MPGSDLVLQQVLEELPKLHGIAAYSLYQLPEDATRRRDVVQEVLEQGKTFYFAVEGLQLSNVAEQERIETLWQVSQALPECPQQLN